ncbi:MULTISPECIES: MurR/RpiR family transcriptional regulator [unclassified Enterococcus]|uniref:MurR/RpiR family transcriptional regulator n=1 Tax=unclassified Enterococcus TaxID=2608891 RepID=UPI0015528C33|nr:MULTISPECIES: MurR/RpiR family transcriptional regulator [unclassified Enterococcus]MBS7577786.1 MurR/RpiR family transcriptional regulator [Enterococcus sp. MMGLQ5-2]MBS7585046.1 MurR/RpiR family transcriptional regulator [Enterococcus sp. MMGLQ5-1]NPD12902.1 MurR/RpiR family transcriptional regulator [Enterococcus sp. MMGLQ5-1]NPD37616.1 MurR/RpiR family transcriptional regulator [Enterococcus sp. MMGLQ5-2]
MQQNIILTIQDYYKTLPTSEKKVAEYILKHTNEVISLSAQELAKKSGSSPAAIIRFCHSIEVNGFTDLKLLLSANMGAINTQMYTEIEDGESVGAIKEKLQHRLVHALERTNEHLKIDGVEKAVEAIETAEIIYIYGLGASSLVAQDIHQKFTRLGLNVFYTMDHHLFASAIGTSQLKGVFIGISNSGDTFETNLLANLALQNGLKLVGITADSTSYLAQKSQMLLLTPEGEEAPLRSAATVSLIAQLFVVDILFFAYCAKNYQSALEKVQNSKNAVNILTNSKFE